MKLILRRLPLLIKVIALLLRLPIANRMRVLTTIITAVRVIVAYFAHGTVAPTAARCLALIPIALIVIVVEVIVVVASAAASTSASTSATVLVLILISISTAAALIVVLLAMMMTAAAAATT